MTREDLAKTFAAYLLGPLALGSAGKYGPYQKPPSRDDDWQLDSSNDYWLHIRGDEATISCRYESQQPVIEAAVAFFKLRFEDPKLRFPSS